MIALFGGTYDPVHLGHLRVAWEASLALECPVRLVPCHTPPHRRAPVAPPRDRAELVRLALEGQDRLVLDSREIERGGVSYTVDTLRELRAEAGLAEPIVALIGADAFAQLPTWRSWRELFELAHIGVVSRPGDSAPLDPALRDAVATRIAASADELRRLSCGKVLKIPVTALGISASAIRAELAAGRDARWLAPDAVLAYAARAELYRAPRSPLPPGDRAPLSPLPPGEGQG